MCRVCGCLSGLKSEIPFIESNAFNLNAVQCSVGTSNGNIQMYKNCCIQLCTELEALGHVVRKHPLLFLAISVVRAGVAVGTLIIQSFLRDIQAFLVGL